MHGASYVLIMGFVCNVFWTLRSYFLELHSTTQTSIARMHTHPYEHTHANPTPMSTYVAYH